MAIIKFKTTHTTFTTLTTLVTYPNGETTETTFLLGRWPKDGWKEFGVERVKVVKSCKSCMGCLKHDGADGLRLSRIRTIYMLKMGAKVTNRSVGRKDAHFRGFC